MSDKNKEKAETKKGGKIVVAAGKSLTSKKGILGPGAEVKAKYFENGKTVIEKFLANGILVKA